MPDSGQFQSADAAFPWLAWKAPSERARLYFLPGMGSAPSEFAPLGESLAAAGISVHSAAVRGQGLDPVAARRGTEVNRAVILHDLEAWIAQTESTVPIFLGGESMGALLAMASVLDSEFLRARVRGLVLLCPVVELQQKTPPVVVQMVRFLAQLFPGLSLHPGLFIHGKASAPQLTVDSAYQEFLRTAPFRLPRAGLGFYAGMSRLMDHCRTAGPRLTLPTLVLGGANDPYITPAQLRAWFESLRSKENVLRIFPNSYHLLLRDPDRTEVLAAIQSFVGASSSTGNGARDESR